MVRIFSQVSRINLRLKFFLGGTRAGQTICAAETWRPWSSYEMANSYKPRVRTVPHRIHITTWNVGTVAPPEDLDTLLSLQQAPLPDVYCIGLQEVGPADSHPYKNEWTTKLTQVLGEHGYFRLKLVKMQGLLSMAFVKRCQIPTYTHVESERSKAGMGGWWGNKGGVSIRFDINGVNFIVVNSHLAAHQYNVAERLEDFFTILATQKFRDDDVDNILDHDYVFWTGDLNFRLDNITRADVERELEDRNYETLLKCDQLNRAREEGLIFVDFEEGKVNFPPTYKFDIGTDTYDTSLKQRIPAWCDRILWMVHEDSFQDIDLSAEQKFYTSYPEYTISDHKPVCSLFHIQVFPSPPRKPSVEFNIPSTWQAGTDVDIFFTFVIRDKLSSSGWDWIGLYKENFTHVLDYDRYLYGKNNAEKYTGGVTLTWKGASWVTTPGKYRLMYVSWYKNTIMGMSEEFEITL